MSEQIPEEIDLSIIVASILQNEGGEYALPFSVFSEVASSNNKAISITPVDDGVTIMLELVEMEPPSELIVPGK